MFDYHMHSTVSFDGQDTPARMVQVAADAGLLEICFTDHIDFDPQAAVQTMVFDQAVYDAAYDHLQSPGLKIRKGLEFGLTPDNQAVLQQVLQRRNFDFVIGSVHFIDNLDVYMEPYWQGKSVVFAYREFMEQTLRCVQTHAGFDVLGHLTFICKCRANPTHELLRYADYREISDEILRELARKGLGLEINTSGVDRCGGFLPTADFLRRFRELGGEIVTVGSDAHTASRVGQYSRQALDILKDIFGYVCTFENRQPIFHKL